MKTLGGDNVKQRNKIA